MHSLRTTGVRLWHVFHGPLCWREIWSPFLFDVECTRCDELGQVKRTWKS